jgi:hypothetical protein
MAGRWWQSRRCGAKTRKGGPCIAKATRNGRRRNHGGCAQDRTPRPASSAGGQQRVSGGQVGSQGAQQVHGRGCNSAGRQDAAISQGRTCSPAATGPRVMAASDKDHAPALLWGLARTWPASGAPPIFGACRSPGQIGSGHGGCGYPREGETDVAGGLRNTPA